MSKFVAKGLCVCVCVCVYLLSAGSNIWISVDMTWLLNSEVKECTFFSVLYMHKYWFKLYSDIIKYVLYVVCALLARIEMQGKCLFVLPVFILLAFWLKVLFSKVAVEYPLYLQNTFTYKQFCSVKYTSTNCEISVFGMLHH